MRFYFFDGEAGSEGGNASYFLMNQKKNEKKKTCWCDRVD